MKQSIPTLLLFFFCLYGTGQTVRPLRNVASLVMPGTAGMNGGTVTQNQKNRNYYATLIGNITFPLAIFNTTGDRISPFDLRILYDVRGLWYNPAQRTFHGNGYGDNGWFKYVMDEEGIPYNVAPLFEGQHQPFSQSVAAYSQKENLVYFLKGNAAVAYDASTGKELPDRIKFFKTGYSIKQPPPPDYKIDSFKMITGYNTTTLIYTGITNSEFGLLNVEKREVELYSASTGLLFQRLQLPPEAVVKERFNFAFCNGIYWFYDNASRTWSGFK